MSEMTTELHIASEDYPELEEILSERLPPRRALEAALRRLASLRVRSVGEDEGYNQAADIGVDSTPLTEEDDEPDLIAQGSWDDVQSKAHDIYSIGGVHILAITDNTVAADVLGDHGTYQSELDFQPGSSGRARAIANWKCFLPDAPVLMADGTEKPISDVRVGDEVITHLGNVQPVVRVQSKHSEDDLVRIQFLGDPREFVSTVGHEIWLKRGNEAPRWTPANQVQVGDFVSRSILTEETPLLVSVTHPVKGLTSALKVDQDLAYLIGWYIAEGLLVRKQGGYRVAFSLNASEMAVCDRLDVICKEKFGVIGTRRVINNAIDYRVSSWQLYDLLDQVVGTGAHDKRLARGLLELPLDQQEQLMAGWIEGDGNQYEGRTTLSSASIPLLYQAREIMARLGMVATLIIGTNQGGPTHRERRFEIGHLRWSATQYRRVFREDGAIWCRVTAINQETHRGEVWDVEVAEDHSLRVYGINAHNCTCPWASYAFGRSGQWMKYEGRMCSHALALMYAYQSSPEEGISDKAGPGNWDTDDITYYEPGQPKEWRIDAPGPHDELYVSAMRFFAETTFEDDPSSEDAGSDGLGETPEDETPGGVLDPVDQTLKQALKTFTYSEQNELIKEGEDGVVASNLDRLILEGTHYEALEVQLKEADETGEPVYWWS